MQGDPCVFAREDPMQALINEFRSAPLAHRVLALVELAVLLLLPLILGMDEAHAQAAGSHGNVNIPSLLVFSGAWWPSR